MLPTFLSFPENAHGFWGLGLGSKLLSTEVAVEHFVKRVTQDRGSNEKRVQVLPPALRCTHHTDGLAGLPSPTWNPDWQNIVKALWLHPSVMPNAIHSTLNCQLVCHIWWKGVTRQSTPNRGQASGSQPACRCGAGWRTCYQLRFSQSCVGDQTHTGHRKLLKEAVCGNGVGGWRRGEEGETAFFPL